MPFVLSTHIEQLTFLSKSMKTPRPQYALPTVMMKQYCRSRPTRYALLKSSLLANVVHSSLPKITTDTHADRSGLQKLTQQLGHIATFPLLTPRATAAAVVVWQMNVHGDRGS